MPTPRAGESQDNFVQRCIPIVLSDGTASDNEQAVAVCISMWEQDSKEGAEGDEMSKATEPREHKTLPFIVTKVDQEQGIVEHTVAVMGNVDLGGDRILPGAFTKTIMERAGKIRVLDSHNSHSVMSVIGKPLSLWEVGRDELDAKVRLAFPEAAGALMARTQFLMDTPEGKGAFTRIRDGAVDEYSIGYDPIQADYSDEVIDGKSASIRNLKEIRLWEYSPVAFAMNPATSTLSAKEADPPRYEPVDDGKYYTPDWLIEATDELKAATGSTSLPIADRARAWDSTAAQRRVRAWANAQDAPNERYRRAFFWYDSANADQFGAYKLQFADVVDGTLTAIPRGVFAVAAVLQGSRGGVDIPSGDAAGVRSRVSRYYARMRSQFEDDSIVAPWDKADDTEPDTKAGRTFSARNIERIRSAIDAARSAFDDLGKMLDDAMPRHDEPDDDEKAAPEPDAQAATGQDQEAGPPDQAPTREELLADIDDLQKMIQRELTEEQ